MRNTLRSLLLLLGILLTTCGPAEAVVLDVLLDAYVQDFTPSGSNLDGVPETIHDTNALLAARGTLSSGATIDSRAILVFDIGPYAGMTLSSAALSGFGGRVDNGFQPDPITAHFFGYAGDGVITLADFDEVAAPAGQADLPGVTQFPFNLAPFNVPVTPVVQSLLSGNEAFLEFRVEADALTAYLEAGPRLTLEFAQQPPTPPTGVVPEPASLWLSTLGLTLLLGRGRRRPWHVS